MNKQDEYTMNSQEDIVKKCQEATSGLINLCNDICFNKTSDNILYLAIGKVAKYSDTRALRWTQKIIRPTATRNLMRTGKFCNSHPLKCYKNGTHKETHRNAYKRDLFTAIFL